MSEKITITFVTSDGEKFVTEASIGKNVLEIAREIGAPLAGACEASLACATCHVIVEDKEYFEKTKGNLEDNSLTEEEEDLLDMAPEVSMTSRLGCQIILTKDMDGMVLKIPMHNRND
ncbi:2Fe-2S iron-sulfur cluster-binding protein [Rickettsiales bacterium LUAb2]